MWLICIYIMYLLHLENTHTVCTPFLSIITYMYISIIFTWRVFSFVMKPVFKIVNFYFSFLRMKTHCFCLTLTQLYFKDNASLYFDSQSKLLVIWRECFEWIFILGKMCVFEQTFCLLTIIVLSLYDFFFLIHIPEIEHKKKPWKING